MNTEIICILILLAYSVVVTILCLAYRTDAKLWQNSYYHVSDQMDEMFED